MLIPLILTLVVRYGKSEDYESDSSEYSNKTGGIPFTCGQDEELAASGLRTNLWKGRLWPYGEVVYEFHSSFTDKYQREFIKAVEDFGEKTCIKFRRRGVHDKGYILAWVNNDGKDHCARATLCYWGERTNFVVRYDCYDMFIMVHELLHSLCMIHEHQRVDRDEYLTYVDCNDASQIAPIYPDQKVSGSLYDYMSTLHYPCGECRGKPIMDGFINCGNEVNRNGLSVLDADKVNEHYNCQGCFRHRWYTVAYLNDEKSKHFANFAALEGDKEPIYACRGYAGVKGEIAAGRYFPNERICQISAWGSGTTRLFNVTKHIQVLALPFDGNRIISGESTTGYRLQSHPKGNSPLHSYVAVGRTSKNKRIFLVTGEEDTPEGTKTTILGKWYEGYSVAIFVHPVNGITQPDEFNVFACVRY